MRTYSCNTSTSASSLFQPPQDGPFTISIANKIVVIGCHTFGTYTTDWGEARRVSSCKFQSDRPYYRYGCCEITLLNNFKFLNFTCGCAFYLLNSTTDIKVGKCGFSTILNPSTFTIVDNKTDLFWGDGKKAYYGLHYANVSLDMKEMVT